MTATATRTLAECLQELSAGEAVPVPAVGETWHDMLDRVGVIGRIAEVDEETYWHFLEVLPPRYIDERFFLLCRGDGTVLALLEAEGSSLRSALELGADLPAL